ncbi:DUF4875 domain-containing protein [Desulfovibrio mangrovi]|uniref:DUF4875 domain-containing protein n=1 Tax=Desulfovibrio mangrovi TaxID=2976983 RepID=UPI002247067F|nr:DUF4875 domain-containing protein [Desulfovibrio mangrovi]UZP67697.1 DUF4875 domain-containing protein [Desulfovibrio mangrovi]
MRKVFLFCCMLVLLSTSAFAGMLDYQIVELQRFDATKINRHRLRTDIVIKDVIAKPMSDIIETSKFAAADVLKKNKAHAVTVRVYPSEHFIRGGTPLCITEYSPDGYGWSGTGSGIWAVQAAGTMPDAKTVRIAEEWGRLYPKYHKGLDTDEKGLRKEIAKNLKIPYDDAAPAFIFLDKME